MCVSPWVLLVVADRLAADRQDWRPFSPADYLPGYLRHIGQILYPPAIAAPAP